MHKFSPLNFRGASKGFEIFFGVSKSKGCETFFGANKGCEKKLRGAKILWKNLRGAKISVENIRGVKRFTIFPKNTPTGYPDLEKTGPLVLLLTFPPSLLR